MSNFVNLLDIIYPIGSVYITFNTISPANTVGGTWELLKNVFLYSSADTIGITGGENTHKLTVDEMSPHTHHISVKPAGNNVANNLPYQIGAAGLDYSSTFINKYVESNGGGQPHNNMPPYITVHMYRRTA